MIGLIVLSFLISFFGVPPVIVLAKKLGMVTLATDSSHPAHTHKGSLPRGGGLPIFLGILIPMLYFLHIKIVVFLIIGMSLVVVVGLIDDKYNLSPYLRFALNMLASLIVVVGGVGIPFVTNPFSGVMHLDQFKFTLELFGNTYTVLWLADLVAVIWITWCMNMVNWSKGVDGQLPGFVFIAAIFLGIVSLRFSRHDISKEIITLLCFLTAFSFLGFLPWNFYPQKILPGYAAGSLAGYLLAVLSILSWGKLGTLMLVLALPMTDAVLVFFRRLLSGKSPFRADRGHFHHILLDMGWSRRRIAIFYWLVSLITGFFSFWVSSEKKVFGAFLLFFVLSGIVFGSAFFVKNSHQENS